MKLRKLVVALGILTLVSVALVGCGQKTGLRTKGLAEFAPKATELKAGYTDLNVKPKHQNPEVKEVEIKDGDKTKKVSQVTVAGETFTVKDKFKTLYQSEINSKFNYLINGRKWNSDIYANMIEGLIGHDKYGEYIGLMARGYKKVSNANGTETWTFQLRENIPWVENKTGKIYEVNGKKQYVKAEDFVTSIKYILTPQNASETLYMVKPDIVGSEELYQKAIGKLNKNFDPKKGESATNKKYEVEPQAPTDEDWKKLGVKAISEYEIEYTLKKPTPYFLSVLTYSPFLPAHAGYLKANGTKFATNENRMLVNGPYLMHTHREKNVILFEKNFTYFDHKHVYANWIEMKYLDVTKFNDTLTRGWFESGDIDSFAVRQKDNDGWKNYVEGTDKKGTLINPANPLANSKKGLGDGATYNFSFNFYRTTFDKSQQKDKKADNTTNKAIWNLNFRKAFLYGINFVNIEKYPNEKNPITAVVRGFTIPELVTLPDGKDYVELINKRFADAHSKPNANLYGLNKDINSKTDDVYDLEKAKECFKNAIKELKTAGLKDSDFPIVMESIKHPTNEKQAKILEEFTAFAKAMNDLKAEGVNEAIKFVFNVADNEEERLEWLFDTANYDFTINSGWGPDYADPSTYLNTFNPKTDGALLRYMGFFVIRSNYKDEAEYNAAKEAMEKKRGELLDLYNQSIETAIKETSDLTNRYNLFADAEYKAIFENVIFIPYSSRANISVVVSRTVPKTSTTNVTYGLTPCKISGVLPIKDILTRVQYEKIVKAYEEGK